MKDLFEQFDVSPQVVSLNDQIKSDCEDRLNQMVLKYIESERDLEGQSKEFLFYRATRTIIRGIESSLKNVDKELSDDEMMALYPLVGTLALAIDRLAEVVKDLCGCAKCLAEDEDSE